MERRKFIKLGAAAGVSGVAALGGPSYSVLNDNLRLNQRTEMTYPEIKDYLARVDHGLVQIDEWQMDKVPKSENNQGIRDWSAENKLVRDSLKTLFLTGMFADLPDQGRVHPEVQDRLWQNMTTMDQAVFGTADYLKSRTSSQNADLKRMLAQRSNPGMQVAEELDTQARALGMSLSRRMQTRNMFAQASFRLAHQDPATIYHEYTTKIEKMAARHGSSEEMQRRLATRVSEKMFWEKQQYLNALAKQWESSGEGIGKTTAAAAAASESGAVSTGAWMMGIGAIVAVVGYIIVETGTFGGVFVVTAGAVLLVIGLIVSIVGAIASSGKS